MVGTTNERSWLHSGCCGIRNSLTAAKSKSGTVCGDGGGAAEFEVAERVGDVIGNTGESAAAGGGAVVMEPLGTWWRTSGPVCMGLED